MQLFIRFIARYLIPPSKDPYDLRIHKSDIDSDIYNRKKLFGFLFLKEKLEKMYPLSGGKRNGFFVEAGAHDGEYTSNTLYLELNLNWTGLLVEPQSKKFQTLLSKNRKTWNSNCCLSTKPYPFQVSFTVLI